MMKSGEERKKEYEKMSPLERVKELRRLRERIIKDMWRLLVEEDSDRYFDELLELKDELSEYIDKVAFDFSGKW
jgi:hypothetical protein